MGDATVAVQAGEFIETTNRAPGRAFTTSEMIERERDTIQVMRAGQNQHAPIASLKTRRHVEQAHSHLSKSQRAAVEQILSSRDQRGRRARRLRGGRFCANVTRGAKVSYDPRRLHGVTLYRETERGFSEGDRVQFTAPNRERHIANPRARHHRKERR